MNSKGIYSLTTILLCMIIFIHYASSQPIEVNSKEDDDDNFDNELWNKAASDLKSNDDVLPNFLLLHNELNELNQPNASEPMRRANFWKRANFWRKRANFWRRNIAP